MTKKAKQAIEDLTNAIRLKPQNASYWYYRAEAHETNGDWNSAIKDYGKSIELDPKDIRTYERRALVYRIQGDKRKAARDYRKILKLQPNHYEKSSMQQFISRYGKFRWWKVFY